MNIEKALHAVRWMGVRGPWNVVWQIRRFSASELVMRGGNAYIVYVHMVIVVPRALWAL